MLKNRNFFFFLRFYLFIFRERGREEGETLMCERNIDRLPLTHALTGDQTHYPGMCPDWESNQ